MRARQQVCRGFGVAEASRAHTQAHRHIPDAVTVHGEVGCAGAGNDTVPGLFNLQQHLGADGLDLGDDQIGFDLLNGLAQGRGIQHVEHP